MHFQAISTCADLLFFGPTLQLRGIIKFLSCRLFAETGRKVVESVTDLEFIHVVFDLGRGVGKLLHLPLVLVHPVAQPFPRVVKLQSQT